MRRQRTRPIGSGPLLRRAIAAIALALAVPVLGQFDNSPSPTAPDNPYDRAVANPIRDHAAPRVLQGARRAQDRDPIPAGDTEPGALQTGELASWPRLFRDDNLLVTGSLTGSLGLFKMWNNAFGIPPGGVTPTYRADPGWGEFFLEPGLTARYTLNPSVQLYGGIAYMETGTRGTDYGGVGSIWHGDTEQLYGGVRFGGTGNAVTLDLSYGQQDFSVGTSLLIAVGASNGAQRGATFLQPRTAWANAGLAKATWSDFSAQGFYLKPNDASSAATGTRLAGVNVEWLHPGPVRAGAMYLHVPESNIVTRDGLNVYDLRARVHPVTDAPQLWLQGEFVWQRKTGVAANGWYLELNYNARDTAWKPLVSVRYASFSGDRPGTANWEGFDPLYFGGSNPDWYQGNIGSTVFMNTNLDTIAATLTLTPNANTILQFVYLNFAADQVDSPLAIPAAGQPPLKGGGVPARQLASEFDAIYTYTFNKNVNINGFVAYAAPSSGYQELYASEGGKARGWWAIGTQFNVSY